ncbi:hypothetical protein E4U43_006197 [Claviceps pusilla]|uniref:Uncharacterized protein n=1 Tax=Claviceps pusilla TaxID=123648 RepID=A0A9P7N161_9HYPO|nr:hypothetical protein E4U43_006197 [Claviceps pusilla]
MAVNTTPRTSSPLNPNPNPSPPRQQTPSPSPAGPCSGHWPRGSKSMSPTERLQRCKVADAWKKHVLMEETRALEKVLVEAIQSREKTSPIRAQYPPRGNELTSWNRDEEVEHRRSSRENDHEEDACTGPGPGVERDGSGSSKRFRLHFDLSFFAPKVALAVGFFRGCLG